MKAKDGVKGLLSFVLFLKRRVSRRRAFVLPVLGTVAADPQRSTRNARLYPAVGMLLLGGFCVPALAGPTSDLTSVASSGYIGLSYFLQIEPQPAAAAVMDPLVGPSTNQGILIYDRGAGGDNWILLGSRLSYGGSSADTLAHVPAGLFDQSDGGCVSLYPRLTEGCPSSAGFEKWAPIASGWLPATPSPGGIVLAGTGVCLVGWLRRWRKL